MEKCTTILAVREMQIQVTMKYHCTPAKMAVTKRDNTKIWPGNGKWNPSLLTKL